MLQQYNQLHQKFLYLPTRREKVAARTTENSRMVNADDKPLIEQQQ